MASEGRAPGEHSQQFLQHLASWEPEDTVPGCLGQALDASAALGGSLPVETNQAAYRALSPLEA